jgi:hypothetical protein
MRTTGIPIYGLTPFMRTRLPFIVSGLLAVWVALISVALVQPPRCHPTNDIAIRLLGYTNGSSGHMAILEVTNRTSRTFLCEVGARAVEKGKGALAWDGGPPSHAHLAPRGTCILQVEAAPDTNRWHVLVSVSELRTTFTDAQRSGRRVRVAQILQRLGLYDPDPKHYEILSPGFSRPAG